MVNTCDGILKGNRKSKCQAQEEEKVELNKSGLLVNKYTETSNHSNTLMNTYNFLFSFFRKCFSPHSLSEFQNNFVGRAVVFYVGDVVRWTFLFIRILEGLLLRGVGLGEESEEDWAGPYAVCLGIYHGVAHQYLYSGVKKKKHNNNSAVWEAGEEDYEYGET